MPTYDWTTWLTAWNKELLERLDLEKFNDFVASDTTEEVLESGWLGYQGAKEEEIKELEERLDISLPPSYRQFLMASNGFRQPGELVPRLYSIQDIDWFYVRNQSTIDLFTSDPELQDDDCYGLFVQYLPHLLEISARESNGTAQYFLNPKVISEDGEWQAFYYAHWFPGAVDYDSFWELMNKERKSFLKRR